MNSFSGKWLLAIGCFLPGALLAVSAWGKETSSSMLVDRINSASQTVYVLTHALTHQDIAHALIRARERGVAIRILLDPRPGIDYYTTPQFLKVHNLPFALATDPGEGGQWTYTLLLTDDKALFVTMPLTLALDRDKGLLFEWPGGYASALSLWKEALDREQIPLDFREAFTAETVTGNQESPK